MVVRSLEAMALTPAAEPPDGVAGFITPPGRVVEVDEEEVKMKLSMLTVSAAGTVIVDLLATPKSRKRRGVLQKCRLFGSEECGDVAACPQPQWSPGEVKALVAF